MPTFDQAARYATQVEPEAVIARLLSPTKAALRFGEWLDTRTTPRPGDRDLTADRVASLLDESAPERPWLLILEFQSQHDPDKLDVTLAEAARLRIDMRHGPERRGKYNVCTALIYLRGRCPEAALDMTLTGGFGTRHAPLVWNVGEDSAEQSLADVTAGRMAWGLLFWIPLMQGGGEVAMIERWKELASAIADRRLRADLIRVVLIFAELAGCVLAWEKGLEGWDMTESQLVNRWTEQARREERILTRREDILETLQERFPGAIPAEILDLIRRQDSLDMLKEWFHAAVTASSAEQFLAVVRR